MLSSLPDSDRIAEYDMKLMDIDADQLGIPDTEYDARVTMPSTEFARIVRDLGQLGESVRIEVSKDGVRFAAEGEAANGSILLKHNEAASQRYEALEKEQVKKEKGDADEDVNGSENGDDDNEEGTSDKKVRIKKEKTNGTVKVKKEKADEDAEMKNSNDVDSDEGEFKAESDDEGEDEKNEIDSIEEEKGSKKRKKSRPAVRVPLSILHGSRRQHVNDDGLFLILRTRRQRKPRNPRLMMDQTEALRSPWHNTYS